MNAAARPIGAEIHEYVLQVPEPALQRFLFRLRQARASGEAWDAGMQYGAPIDALHALLDYWCDELDFRGLERRFNELPLLSVRRPGHELCFAHLRSTTAKARPLLLLHGYFGSIAEFQRVLGPLTRPELHGAPPDDAFHVVCPALPGLGLSDAHGEPTPASVAESCASLMASLGYEQYLVHGSDLGASVAAELVRVEPERVRGAHVTSLPVLPLTTAAELSALSDTEKSALAGLSYMENLWRHAPPQSAVEHLAFALAQLADSSEPGALASYCEPLLWGLTLSMLGQDEAFAARLGQRARCLRLRRSEVPTLICSFPLAPPSLRRFAERSQRVVEWQEHARGGAMPALEQPDLWLQSLRGFCARYMPSG